MEDEFEGLLNADVISLSANELWAIHDYVRKQDEHGLEWDKDFNTRIMEAILATQSAGHPNTTVIVDQEELWQIDRQVPSALMVGTQPVGRSLLLKVMAVILKMRRGIREEVKVEEKQVVEPENTATEMGGGMIYVAD